MATADQAVRDPKFARERFDGGSFALGFGPQPMIDGHGKKLGAASTTFSEPLRPTRGQDEQSG